MTVQSPPRAEVIPLRKPSANGRRPVRIAVDQHELVGVFMDVEALAHEAREALAFGLQSTAYLGPCPERDAIRQAFADIYKALKAIDALALSGASRYDHGPRQEA